MENTEKIEKLEKEITELEKKKQDKNKVNELLGKRNELKFTKLYGLGRGLKKLGSGLANWADAKNKEIEETKKDKPIEKKQGKPVDLYDELFGNKNQELNMDLGIM